MKRIVKNIIRSAGFELHRLYPTSSPSYQLLLGLNKFQIDVVFDIGANTGQFAQELRDIGYSGRIVSFEPLSDAHAKLSQTAHGDRKWDVYKRGAIGDFNGETEINISGNSVSSSLLPMLNTHSSAEIESSYISSELTPIRTLDIVAPPYIKEAGNLFIKIDTQGFEWQVFDGGKETLKNVKGLLVELSLIPLYEGQRLWREVIDRLTLEGFTLWAIQKGFTDVRDGRTFQIDVIFFRTNDIFF